MVRKNNNSQKKVSSSVTAFFCSILILLGLFLFFYNFISKRRILAYDYINEQINMDVDIRIVTEEDQEEEIDEPPSDLQHYIGYLEIPKINFNRGFYHVDSSENTVEKNIQLIRGSNMPTKNGGNLIIAGHSGTGWKAFFNELYQLTNGDIAIVTYKDHKYTYKLVNSYRQPKTGQITIKRNKNKTTLTLITCTNNDSTTQTVYILELANKE